MAPRVSASFSTREQSRLAIWPPVQPMPQAGLIKPSLQDQLAQAQAAFTTITTEGGAALKAAAAAVSKAQDAAQQVSKGLPDVSRIARGGGEWFSAWRELAVSHPGPGSIRRAVARGSLTSGQQRPGALAEAVQPGVWRFPADRRVADASKASQTSCRR